MHKRQKSVVLRASDWIVCVSEHTKKDLLTYYPFCQDKPVSVIPNGVEGFAPVGFDDAFFHPLGVYEPGSYFLYVGHRGSCKGFDRVHDVLDELGDHLKCLVVGAPFTPEEENRIKERGQTVEFIHAGRVTDAQLNCLYSNARFFFFPSLYEGFGIPPLEAMQAGCPVLASDRSSIPEVVGNAGLLFDPDSLDSLKNALAEIMQKGRTSELIQRGRDRAAIFCWEKVIATYADLYVRILHSLHAP